MKNLSITFAILLLTISSLYSQKTYIPPTFVYQITNEEALTLQKIGFSEKNWQSKYLHTLVDSFYTKSEQDYAGHFIFVKVNGQEVDFQMKTFADFTVKGFYQDKTFYIQVLDTSYRYLENAIVRFRDETIDYNENFNAYPIKTKKYRTISVQVNDIQKSYYLTKEGLQLQKLRYNFRSKVRNKFNRLVFKKYKKPKVKHNGYIVISQPKYRHLDTVRVKTYITNKKGKPFEKEVEFHIIQTDKYKSIYKKKVLPNTLKGNYTLDFALGDSLKLDKTYYVYVNKLYNRSWKRKELFKTRFYLEDYELDKVKYNFKAKNTEFERGKSKIILKATGKDQNDNFIPDGTVKITILRGEVMKFYENIVLVPDTVWRKTIDLSTDRATQIIIPWEQLPSAKMKLHIHAEFSNSNGEYEKKTQTITVDNRSDYIILELQDSMVVGTYYKNGQILPKEAHLLVQGSTPFVQNKPIQLPFKQKINPYFNLYSIFTEDLSADLEISNTAHNIYWNGKNTVDSIKIKLHNPRQLPIYYKIYEFEKVVAEGQTEAINWAFQQANRKNYTYSIEYKYLWSGQQQTKYLAFPFYKDFINLEIEQPKTVLPGEKITVKIKAKDSEANPAPSVNLTAFAINSAFKQSGTYQPPVKGKPRHKFYLWQKNYNIRSYRNKNIKMTLDSLWYDKFGLEKLANYRIRYPKNSILLEYTDASATDSFYKHITQFSPYITKNGNLQPIHLIYVNNKLVYYSGAVKSKPYAFVGQEGYNSITIRTTNHSYRIDSVLLKNGQKLEIAFDENNYQTHLFGKHIERTTTPKDLTIQEKSILNKTMFFFKEDLYAKYDIYLRQREAGLSTNIHYIERTSRQPIGPFHDNWGIEFTYKDRWQENFEFESGFRYKMTKDRDRLYKHQFFDDDKKINLTNNSTNDQKVGQFIYTPSIIQTKTLYPFSHHLMQYAADVHNYKWIKLSSANCQLNIQKNKKSKGFYGMAWFQDGIFLDFSMPFFGKNDFSQPLGDYQVVFFKEDSTYFTVPVSLKKDTTVFQHIDSDLVFKTDTNLLFLHTILGSKSGDTLNTTGVRKGRRYQIQRTQAASKPTISGQITDFETGKPRKIKINIKSQYSGQPIQTIESDENGFFSIEILEKDYYTIFLYDKKNYTYFDAIYLYIEGNEDILLNMQLKSKPRLPKGRLDIGYFDSESQLNTEEPLIRQDNTTQGRKISGKDIASLPSKSLSGMVATAAGASSTDDGGVTIRGSRSNSNIIYIDGIRVNGQLPPNTNASSTESWPVRERTKRKDLLLTGGISAAYGDATGELFSITTNDIEIRKIFQDYAYWQPNLITDQNGETYFTVKFPDDITQWNTTVIGMDDQLRSGISFAQTKAFKPVMGQLAIPRFLIEGDQTNIIGKSINYTMDSFDITTTFSQNGTVLKTNQAQLTNALIEKVSITAPEPTDSLKLQYQLITGNYGDGEERVIPVFRQGISETKGAFYILEGDTTIELSFDKNINQVKLYARANLLDVLLEDIEYLRKYPYGCNEQSASRLTALLLKKRIKAQLNEPFEEEKELLQMVTRLQSTQNKDGSWGWWANNEGTTWMTTYITKILHFATKNGYPQLQPNLDKALKYITNIGFYKEDLLSNQKLKILELLSDVGQNFDYETVVNELDTLPVSLYQQMILTKVKQNANLPYTLDSLDKHMKRTTFGGKYWGNYNYHWYDNSIQISLAAHDVYKKAGQTDVCKGIRQYLLEKRQHNGWRNTFEAAQILNLILPELLKGSTEIKKSEISINDNEQIDLKKKPFEATLTNGDLKISKTGTAPVYLTAFQTFHNPMPKAKSDIFEIKTVFQQQGKSLRKSKVQLAKNETVNLIAIVEVKEAADYVMIEIPIPAGCSYASKPKGARYYEVHREYFKHKTSIFCRNLRPGVYTFSIPLEVRYSGEYTINATKAEQMYFPVFYGRNETKQVEVK